MKLSHSQALTKGAHDAENVPAAEYRIDDFFLAGAEGIVAEDGIQD